MCSSLGSEGLLDISNEFGGVLTSVDCVFTMFLRMHEE